MRKLSLAFFGTPVYAAYLLEKIVNDKGLPEVKLVVTQPDRPVGKKQIITPSPVKTTAMKIGNLEIENSLEIENWKLKTKNIDLALVCAFGRILPKEILTIPKFGFWNIHYSLLPHYRGGAPSAYTLINGDKTTGVTILQMDERLDHGPIIAQEETKILPDERRPELEMRLTKIAFEMLKKLFLVLSEDSRLRRLGSLNEARRGPTETSKPGIERKNQKHELATYTKLLTKADGFIPFTDLHKSTTYNRFRGLYPWPGLWTFVTINGQQKRLKIIDMDRTAIKAVQLEGKKLVDWPTFKRAYL